MRTQKEVNAIAYEVVACAIEVHKVLGPGLLESIYEACLIDEMRVCGLTVVSQQFLPLIYKGNLLGNQLKIDLLVEDHVIVELKAVESMIPLYKSQLLSYMRLANKPKGLLINFNCDNITQHMIPLVNDVFAKLPKG